MRVGAGLWLRRSGVGKAPIVANGGTGSAAFHRAFMPFKRRLAQFVASRWQRVVGVPILHSIDTRSTP
jgi:hypothetical protein